MAEPGTIAGRNHRGLNHFQTALLYCGLGVAGRAHDRVVPKQQPWVYNDEDKKMKITKPHSPNAKLALEASQMRDRCLAHHRHSELANELLQKLTATSDIFVPERTRR